MYLYWPFTVRIIFSSDLKIDANSQPLASNFKSFLKYRNIFFITVIIIILKTKYQAYSIFFFRVLLKDFGRLQPMPMCGLCPVMETLSVPVELMRVRPYAAYPKKSRCILWWLVISLLASTREQYYVINYESKLFFEQTHKPLFFLFVSNLEKIHLFIDYFWNISEDNFWTTLR